jgi:hypothetical protein
LSLPKARSSKNATGSSSQWSMLAGTAPRTATAIAVSWLLASTLAKVVGKLSVPWLPCSDTGRSAMVGIAIWQWASRSWTTWVAIAGQSMNAAMPGGATHDGRGRPAHRLNIEGGDDLQPRIQLLATIQRATELRIRDADVLHVDDVVHAIDPLEQQIPELAEASAAYH